MNTTTKVIIAGSTLAALGAGWYLYKRNQESQAATTTPGTTPAGGNSSIIETAVNTVVTAAQNLIDKNGNIFIHSLELDGKGNRRVIINGKYNGAFASLKKGSDGLMYGTLVTGEIWKYTGDGFWSQVNTISGLPNLRY
jgi:hypothetical protein